MSIGGALRRLRRGEVTGFPDDTRISGVPVTFHADTTVDLSRGSAAVTTPAGQWHYAMSFDIPSPDSRVEISGRVLGGEVGVLLVDDGGRRLQEVRMHGGQEVVAIGGRALGTVIDELELNPFEIFQPMPDGARQRPAQVIVRNCGEEGCSRISISSIRIQSDSHSPDPFVAATCALPVGALPSRRPGEVIDALGVRRAEDRGPSGAPAGALESAPHFLEPHELAVLAEAVDAALPRGGFSILSIGAGYGEWLTSAHALVRGRVPVRLAAVEAHPVRVGWIRDHLALNGVPERESTVLHAAVGIAGTEAYMPLDTDPRLSFGAAVVSTGASETGAVAVSTQPLEKILAEMAPLDLVQMDIQGAEVRAWTEAAIAMARSTVAVVCISTHSMVGHVQLQEMFRRGGWLESVSYPIGTLINVVFVDGTELWAAAVDGLLVFTNPQLLST